MNLQDPTIKMSKSAPKDDKGTIFMLDDIEITRFSEKDVVRHKLVQDIIRAYERSYNSEEKKSK